LNARHAGEEHAYADGDEESAAVTTTLHDDYDAMVTVSLTKAPGVKWGLRLADAAEGGVIIKETPSEGTRDPPPPPPHTHHPAHTPSIDTSLLLLTTARERDRR
jgi:hypothetical protein